MGAISIPIANRDVRVELSARAASELASRRSPLVAEMELYFSCLIRKQVRFPESVHPDAFCQSADPSLVICFRPVMTRACLVRDVVDKPDLETFPIARPQAFVPHWLRLDFRDDRWSGEFGY